MEICFKYNRALWAVSINCSSCYYSFYKQWVSPSIGEGNYLCSYGSVADSEYCRRNFYCNWISVMWKGPSD